MRLRTTAHIRLTKIQILFFSAIKSAQFVLISRKYEQKATCTPDMAVKGRMPQISTIVVVLLLHAYKAVNKPDASNKKNHSHNIRHRITKDKAHPYACTQANNHKDERKYHYRFIKIPHKRFLVFIKSNIIRIGRDA